MRPVEKPKQEPETVTAETPEAQAFLDLARKVVAAPAPETKGKIQNVDKRPENERKDRPSVEPRASDH